MNSENLSHTIYRDHDIHGQKSASVQHASWQQLGLENDRVEGFEVCLRLLLMVCVGAALLACGVRTGGTAPVTGNAAQCVPVVQSARVAVAAAAAASLPKVVAQTAQSLR